MDPIEGNYLWKVCIMLLFHRNAANNITCNLVYRGLNKVVVVPKVPEQDIFDLAYISYPVS